MFVFAFPILAVVAIGLLAFSMTASNHYYTGAHTEGYWQAFVHNLTTGFGLTTAVKRLFTQVVSNWMSRAAEAVDAPIGTMFHYLATEVKAWADTNLEFSAFALTVAGAITGQVSWREVNAALRELRQTIKVNEHRAQVATDQAIRQERQRVHSLAQGVYPRLRTIEHELEHPIAREIKTTRHLAREAEREALKAFRVGKHALARTSTKALALALPAVIARLGWDWIKCKEAQNVYNRRGCGMWNDLEGLLGIFAAAELALHVEDVVKIIEELSGPAVSLLDKAK